MNLVIIITISKVTGDKPEKPLDSNFQRAALVFPKISHQLSREQDFSDGWLVVGQQYLANTRHSWGRETIKGQMPGFCDLAISTAQGCLLLER